MKAITAVKGRAGLVSAVDLFNAVIAELGTVPKVFGGDYLKGAILLEFHDEQYEQLPSTNPKSKGAAA
jgi:hypothetical protein